MVAHSIRPRSRLGGVSPSKDFWIDSLRREAGAFRAAITPADLDKPVPSCPDWTVHDLVGHLGRKYRFPFNKAVADVSKRPEEERPVPPSGEAVLEWWDESFADVVTTLEALDPGTPAWNWSPQQQTAAFWHRRMAHETSIHRWDVQTALGLPEPIDPPELAVDGVDEVLDSFLPVGRIAEPINVTGVARLAATDIDAAWDVRIRDNGITLLDTGGWFDDAPEIAAIAQGTASDLLLAVWGRVPISLLTVKGETALIQALRAR